MKKLYFVALAIIGMYACLNFSSCKKDDEPESSIIGLWGLDDYYYNGQFENAMQFNNNGTGVYYDDYPDTQNGADPFTYTFDGKTLNWTWQDGSNYTETWTIVSISNNKIVYKDHGEQSSLTKIK